MPLRNIQKIDKEPLVSLEISQRLNVLKYDKKIRKKLQLGLLSMEEDDHNWITYEEYSLIRTQVESMIDDDELEVTVIKNNLYPEYYPIHFEINDELYESILSLYEEENNEDITIECKNFENIYSGIYLSPTKRIYGANGVNLRSWLFFIAIFPIISVYLWCCS